MTPRERLTERIARVEQLRDQAADQMARYSQELARLVTLRQSLTPTSEAMLANLVARDVIAVKTD